MTVLRRHGDNDPPPFPLRHGLMPPPPLAQMLHPDADLWLVTADPVAWSEAHPCVCESLCECEDA